MLRLATAFSVVLLALTASTADAQQSSNQWYFGMSVSLNNGQLYVNSVVPFGPAAQAGLEAGNIIRNVNGRNFWSAQNDYQAIQILQNAVGFGGGGGGGGGGGTPTLLVQPQPGQANMSVRDVRTGNISGITVFPRSQWGGGGGGVPTN